MRLADISRRKFPTVTAVPVERISVMTVAPAVRRGTGGSRPVATWSFLIFQTAARSRRSLAAMSRRLVTLLVAGSLALVGAVPLDVGPATAQAVHPRMAAADASGDDGPTLRKKARVVRVIDGDRVKVKIVGGARRVVRLIGIDAPEAWKEECGAQYAGRSARRLLPKGTVVTLISDPTQRRVDRFDQLLRYIEMPSGFDIGKAQLRRGGAQLHIKHDTPFERSSPYWEAMLDALNARRGIWGLC